MEKRSRTRIVATIGPVSSDIEILKRMIDAGLDIARLNLAWGSYEEHTTLVQHVREAAQSLGTIVPILCDLPGPRVQEGSEHRFGGGTVVTDKDRESVAWGIGLGIEFFGQSYVGTREDVDSLRLLLPSDSSTRIIAKIERTDAVINSDQILDAADGIMVARGDLGNEVPLEDIPFVQHELIDKARTHQKPVIVATDMMSSMITHPSPSRADVTDVAYAVLSGADAVMLSNETAKGKYPVETIAMMERIILQAEKRGPHFVRWGIE